MRVLIFDIDSLRPDHLGCYGYERNTSPNIDKIAKKGVRFTNYYTSDAPCLPSRTALTTGKFGIRNGVVNHGGEASKLKIDEQYLGMNDGLNSYSFAGVFRQKGLHTALISTFAERHAAWHFNAGYNEIHNIGKWGMESAEEVAPIAVDWLKQNAQKDDWALYVNFWDPHTPYRTPEDYENPFENEPIPEWVTEEVLEKHRNEVGPHTAQEIELFTNDPVEAFPKYPTELKNMEDVKKMFDGYDSGVRYADDHVGQVLAELENQGLLEDTMIIITGDHGENLGELGIYGEHATADNPTCNIPMIIKLPGQKEERIDNELHYSLDILPTLADLLDVQKSDDWDGESFAATLTEGKAAGRDYLVIGQFSHVAQRSVRFGDYLYMRTWHDGFHLFEKDMLFNLKEDPYEQYNIAEEHPELVAKGIQLMSEWKDEQMSKMADPVDPLWTVMKENGPFHAKGFLKDYTERRLIPTGRTKQAEELKKRHPWEYKDENKEKFKDSTNPFAKPTTFKKRDY